ncbi:MAG: sigma-54-dependent Fis family transcriptional regulator [Gemmatimonadetes bacterium]|nr:sigma-54-dependent Fis family transcriptional regulator [Gemmatimonadota bacterium]
MRERQMKVLLVDDESGILESLGILFRGEGYQVVTALGGKDGLAALEREQPDLVVSDIRMPGATGLDILSRAREVDPEMAVVLMTAQASLQSAVRAVNEGAFHYLQKPFANDELLAICRRAGEARVLRAENRELRQEIRRRERGRGERPVGRSPNFTEILDLAETVAPTDSTILLTGESGTGKEVVARYIHARSARSERPFFSINCGALPEGLLESELFGHVKGAFTGAVKDRDGLLVAANGGTFLLDEIGETSPQTQVKLLRAIQEREVIPVGATEPVSVDVRIIAATNRDLEEQIRRGEFRSDLYYRLNVIAIPLPPLRARREDIPLLAQHFVRSLAEEQGNSLELSEEAEATLVRYDWPGNVRELENALERAAVLTVGAVIQASALPESVLSPLAQAFVGQGAPANPTLDVIERAYIQWVLQAEAGNKTRAAEVLGIDPSTLYRKIRSYGLSE